jgi:putative transposase
MRDIMNAIFYVLRSGCPWRMVPDSFAPRSTVYRWFVRLRDEGAFETINHHLLIRDRERVGRAASPSAAVLDSQSIKTTEAGGPRGYDAGKKVTGCKRHSSTHGRALVLQALLLRSRIATALRSLARPSLHRMRLRGQHLCSVPGGARDLYCHQIVHKHPDQIGFAVHPRRWVVERFFAWIGRNRRLSKDFEASIASAKPSLRRFGNVLTRRLARS